MPASKLSFSEGECLLYIGTLNESRNVTQVVKKYFPDNENSIRSSISRDDAVEELKSQSFLKEDLGKYKANEDKLEEVLVSLLEEPYQFQRHFRIEGDDRKRLAEMFSNEEILELFESDRMGEVLGERYSEIKENLSLFVKACFLFLAVHKKILDSDVDLNEEEHATKAEKFQEQLDGFLEDLEDKSGLMFPEEDLNDLKGAMERMRSTLDIIYASEAGEEEFIRTLPDFENQTVNEFYGQVKAFFQADQLDLENNNVI